MHVEGISDAEIDRILAARPFTSLRDFCRRAAPSRPVVENLIHAGALDAFGLDDSTGSRTRRSSRASRNCAEPAFHSWLLVLRGTIRKTGARGISMNCERAWDLPALERARRDGTLDPAALWKEGAAEREAAGNDRRREPAPPRKLWHASGGSAGA